MTDIVMPRLSDSMTEGTVVRWLKSPGEYVRRGEPLAEIETDKATITYAADLDGVLSYITVAEGQTVAVGTQIAIVEPQGAQAPAPQQPAPPAGQPRSMPPLAVPQEPAPLPVPPPQPAEQVQPPGEYDAFTDSGAQPAPLPEHHAVAEEFPLDDQFADAPQQPGIYAQETGEFAAAGGAVDPAERVKASPIARRLARKLGVDISRVRGSGPGGRVVKEDVEAAADAATYAQAAPSTPTQAPAPPDQYAYEPGGAEQYEDEAFESALPGVAALAHEGDQIMPPGAPPGQPAAPGPDPSLIPNFPPPPQAAPMPQPGFTAPPQPFPPQPYGYPAQQPMPQQPFPGPPPFVQGMTGGFPAIPPQMPQQAPPQAPPPQQPPAQPGAPTATRGQSTPIEPTSAQQTVARRMAESKATAPEFFVETEVDMTTCVAYREQLRSMVSPLPSFNDFVIKAAAQALRQYPNVNAAYKDGHFEQYSDVNIGVVVSATEVLAVPTLFNVDQKGLAQIAGESHQLSEAVRTRTIQPSQMSGGTFSISNLGMYGVDRFTAILNPPQAAILAVGAINRRAVIAEDGMSLVIRQIMNMTLTCDHRILYGAGSCCRSDHGRFVALLARSLRKPRALLKLPFLIL